MKPSGLDRIKKGVKENLCLKEAQSLTSHEGVMIEICRHE